MKTTLLYQAPIPIIGDNFAKIGLRPVRVPEFAPGDGESLLLIRDDQEVVVSSDLNWQVIQVVSKAQ